MSDDEWVKAAMLEDSMVVGLLLRLNEAKWPKGKPTPPPDSRPLKLAWTVRQRRSKPVTSAAATTATATAVVHHHHSHQQPNKPAPRASPTTPLSWSGATSVSGGGALDGGSEESSRPPLPSSISSKRPEHSRSKVNATGETTTTKRSRKKKTLAELREEENSLLKERRQLKRELEVLRDHLEKQRATNENLKKIKLDLLPSATTERGRVLEPREATHDQQKRDACEFSSPSLPHKGNDILKLASIPTSCCEEPKQLMSADAKFVLPDLNLPFEDAVSSEVPCGVS